MGSMQNSVCYCCVSKGGKILYAYSGGDDEIENLAVLCLEKAPLYHKWCFHSTGKKTFGFLTEEGYVYFAIADSGLGKHGVLQFLQHIRDEFKKVNMGLRKSMSNLDSLCLQEKLIPVICQLISSLEQVNETSIECSTETPSPPGGDMQIEATKAPLLRKSSKFDKKKMKEHTIAMRGIELEEHRKSADKEIKMDSRNLDSNKQSDSISSIPIQKDSGPIRSSDSNIRKKWCRQVWIVLAIDAAVCVLLFVIWLLICRGTDCVR